jgi:cytoskeleton protein RodZ
MTGNIEPPRQDAADDAQQAPEIFPGLGQMLREARERKGLSLGDVAQTLKLGVRQIQAIEADDWLSLPGQTFVKGFVRNYARLLGLDPAEVARELDRSFVSQPVTLDISPGTNESLPQAGQPYKRDILAVTAGVVLVVLALLAYMFASASVIDRLTESWATLRGLVVPTPSAQSTGPAEPASLAPAVPPEVPSAGPAPLAPAATGQPASPAGGTGEASVSAASPVPVAPPVQPAAAAALPVSGADSTGVHLTFTQPSWVEIRDGSGQIVFSQLNPAGTQRYVEGQPPLTLVIGNATHVTVKYKGQPVALTQRSKDDVARLTLE